MRTFKEYLLEKVYVEDNLSNLSCPAAGEYTCNSWRSSFRTGWKLTIKDDLSASIYVDYDDWPYPESAKRDIKSLIIGENEVLFIHIENAVPEGYSIDQSRREKTFNVEYGEQGATITFHIVEDE